MGEAVPGLGFASISQDFHGIAAAHRDDWERVSLRRTTASHEKLRC